jgi:hypothetical protein
MDMRIQRIDEHRLIVAAADGCVRIPLQTAPPTARVTATASVNFKIVIPKLLSLQLADGGSLSPDAQTVTIMSNGHNVSLNATERTARSSAAQRRR